MSHHRRRIRTIQAIIAGSPAIVNDPLYDVIIREFDEVYCARRVRIRDRRRLLQVLHSTRALDTCLRVFIDFHNCPSARSLGGYLRSLQNHRSPTLRGRLSHPERHRFQNSITNNRNRYMHEAGAYPTDDNEVAQLLSEMQDCLLIVLAL
jgi:hypothetical protein